MDSLDHYIHTTPHPTHTITPSNHPYLTLAPVKMEPTRYLDIRPAFNSTITSTTHATNPLSAVQGPNTSEIFSQDGETPDPYDNVTGEQQFHNGYGDWGHVITHNKRSILPDLKPYPFSDEIKNQADVIYNKMIYRVRRGKIRDQMYFFCVYCAHLELGMSPIPTQIGQIFGLTPGEVQKCDSLFSPLQTGYRPPSTNTSPLRYLPDYCESMNLSAEATCEIMELAKLILRKEPSLFEKNPQTVAAGLLRYYTLTNGIVNDDPEKLKKVTGRSSATTEGMYNRISIIHNS